MSKGVEVHPASNEVTTTEFTTVVARSSGELLRSIRVQCAQLKATFEASSPAWERLAEMNASVAAAMELNDELRRFCGVMSMRTTLMPKPEPAAPPRPPAQAEAPQGPHALIIERDDGLRSLVGEVLRRNGYRPLAASTAQQAEQLLADPRLQVRCILVELLSDDGSGVSLAGRLRQRYPGIRVVYTASETQGAIVPEGALGHDGLLRKPFTVASILDAVKGGGRR